MDCSTTWLEQSRWLAPYLGLIQHFIHSISSKMRDANSQTHVRWPNKEFPQPQFCRGKSMPPTLWYWHASHYRQKPKYLHTIDGCRPHSFPNRGLQFPSSSIFIVHRIFHVTIDNRCQIPITVYRIAQEQLQNQHRPRPSRTIQDTQVHRNTS